MTIKKHQIITKIHKIRTIFQQKKSKVKCLVLQMYYSIQKRQLHLTVRFA